MPISNPPSVVDISLGGNTAGALALISSGTALIAGGNNITLSQNGQSVTISGAAIPAATNFTAGTIAYALVLLGADEFSQKLAARNYSV